MEGKRDWKKIGFGVLFIITCFIAMYVLMEFHGEIVMVSLAAVILLISAFLFFNVVFLKKAVQQDEDPDMEPVNVSNDGEFRLKIAKYMKVMENSQKELIEVLKKQNTLFQAQIENLEHEIYLLSEKQTNQAKSIIKFNKENARQLAISERETLEYVMSELKKAIEDNAGAVAVKKVSENTFAQEAASVLEEISEVAPGFEEVSEAELFEVTDLPGDEEFVIPDLPAPEEIPDLLEEDLAEEIPARPEEVVAEEIPEIPEDLDLSALFEDIAEAVVEESKPVDPTPVVEAVEEEKAEEPAPAADPLAGLGSDPNAMMTPEDIAKLLEAMGQ